MTIKRILVGVAVVVVGLPVVAAGIALATIAVLDRTNGTLGSSGERREYLIHVPERYRPDEPTPLVISMHAGATWPAHQQNLAHWNRLADEHGFIVVYPSASGFPKVWETFRVGAGLERDVRFISDLIDTLRALYNVDPARIYANGMSNGGGMAFVLSCTLSDRIAAVGLVATAQSLPAGWCRNARPVPMVAFHGSDDRIVPYEGGPLGDPFNPVKQIFPAVRDWVGRWARRNRCAPAPVDSLVAPDVMRAEYPDCAPSAEVVLYTLLGAGHSWPGGKPPPRWRVGPTNMSIDATAVQWAFFTAHPLSSR